MKKRNFLVSKKLIKNSTIVIAFLVVITLISSSSMCVTISNQSEMEKFNLKLIEEEPLNAVETSSGLAPIVHVDNQDIQTVSTPFEDTMKGYIANSTIYDEGICYFYLDDPGTIEYIKDTESDDFLSGGTGTSDERWLAVEYGSGILWGIDPEEGDMWSIGGGGVSLNGLAWDLVYNRLYGASGSKFYEIDPDTGEQEFIGSFGSGVNEMIAIASSLDGTMYGWDLGDKLWMIDSNTGEATEIGPLGIDLNYAQDGGFNLDDMTLYLSAFTVSPNYGSYLYYCDVETGECELIGQIEDNSQITASFVSFGCPCVDHDVGVKSINYPDSGYAGENMSMQVTIKNHGNSSETTDVQMQVTTGEPGPILLEEDFSGDTFPPEGWETDWWEQSNTNYACGEPPEARCNKNTQYNHGDYYDNYIMTPALNCSDVEIVNLNFKLTADVYYSNYCYFYIWYRVDSSSPWESITPWDNPIPDIYCEIISINIYGDPYLGEEFQVKWEYIGYYYYFNNLYLDDVIITEYNSSVEYGEIIEDVDIEYGKEITIDFPTWTPSYWQDPEYLDTFQEFQVIASTLLINDHNPNNDCKQKIIDLYFPFFHDVGATNIISPISGPAQTFPVKANIKNFGQYSESNFNTYMKISEINLDTKVELLNQDFTDNTFPPTGWTRTHENWIYSDTKKAGGSYGEAKFHYSIEFGLFRLYTPAIDTSDYDVIEIEFKHYVDHFLTPYSLQVETSLDGENWNVVWSISPMGKIGPETISILTDEDVGSTMYISWTFNGNSYNIDDWYIDDIIIEGYDLFNPEYQDFISVTTIESGEKLEIKFEDWTPEFLAEETTGIKKYIVKAWTAMEEPEDQNPDNNLFTKIIELDFFHDVSIKELTSPSGYIGSYINWLHFDDGTTVNALSLSGETFEYAIRLTPDELVEWAGYEIVTVRRYHGLYTSFEMSGKLKIYEEGTSIQPGDLITETDFDCYYNEWHDIGLYDPVPITGNEDIWISIEATEYPSDQYPAAMDPEGPVFGKSDWIYTEEIGWKEIYTYGYYNDWNLWVGIAGFGCQPNIIYIQPGTYDLNVTVENVGTFPELDLTCYAEIKEYITNCTSETLIYQDNITNIDLEEPLGGTEELNFKSFNFEMEGAYRLFLNMPDDDDDYPKNNDEAFGIIADGTLPSSTHELDPPNPDGGNGWYISDVEVTLMAFDPEINCGHWGSGVKEIKYKIGNGDWQTIHGSDGTFIIDVDGEDILIQYYAIDNVGNQEPIKLFTIDMDQTPPNIDLTYEIISGNPNKGWDFLFTAMATDSISGMSQVEFYLNNILQDTVTGPGPTYEWGWRYHGGLEITITAIAYDIAGNFDSDEIDDLRSRSRDYIKSTPKANTLHVLQIPFVR